MGTDSVAGWWYVGGVERRRIVHVQSPRWDFPSFRDDRAFKHKADAEARLEALEKEKTFQVVNVYQIET